MSKIPRAVKNRKPRNDRPPFSQIKSGFTKALVEFNAKENGSKKFCSYEEGTPEYEAIKKIQERKYPTTESTKQARRDTINKRAKEKRANRTESQKQRDKERAKERRTNRTEEQKQRDKERAKANRERAKAKATDRKRDSKGKFVKKSS